MHKCFPDRPPSGPGPDWLRGACSHSVGGGRGRREATLDDGVGPREFVQARAYVSVVGLGALPATWKRPAKPNVRAVIAPGFAIAFGQQRTGLPGRGQVAV